ncbi:MAG: ATP-binding protein, partial [Candidatus Pacebacteria bacterium]|nr:ATP-binding protein [Candidatus Paceibacterota bacterium]
MPKKGIIKPRPHARIITMIGGQLIRNEKVALMELLKNSYDADASWVQIRLLNFINKDGSLTISKDSAIEIEDDGIGMDFDIIEKVWANPASPYKYLLKKKGKEKTAKGRIIQGEKGIGRFAVFKLGTTVEIFTRAKNKNTEEIYLKSDLSIYDEELINRKNIKSKEPVFIDDIEYAYERGKAKKIKEQEILIYNRKIQRPPYGTLIRITNLSGYWTLDKIKNIFQDSLKLMSPFNKKADFTCHITLNEDTLYSGFKKDALADILSMAPIFMNGQ